jgi:hypothetical protein
MTIVGKILVFVNLIFSLVVGGLVMMVYLTRTNWEFAYNQQVAQYKAVDAERKQEKAEFEAAKKDFDTQLAKANADRDAAIKDKTETNAKFKRATDELEALKSKERGDAANGKVVQTAADVRRDQIRQEEERNQKLREEKRALIEERNEERKARIIADVDKRTYQTRNIELEAKLQEMGRELIRSRSTGSGGFQVRKRGDENPPPDNVEGRVKEVDPEDGLIKLSIGSDAGLQQGHTLKVFRLAAIPEQSRYLGTIEILMVRPHEAVGRPTSRAAGSIRPGDRVASRLLVGGN